MDLQGFKGYWEALTPTTLRWGLGNIWVTDWTLGVGKGDLSWPFTLPFSVEHSCPQTGGLQRRPVRFSGTLWYCCPPQLPLVHWGCGSTGQGTTRTNSGVPKRFPGMGSPALATALCSSALHAHLCLSHTPKVLLDPA